MPRQNNPHQDDVGYVTCRNNTLTGAYNVLYDGQKTGLEDGGRWTILCSYHGSIANKANKREATALLKVPGEWCGVCSHLAEMEEAEYIMTVRATRTPDEQLKRLASLAIGDPEKSQLFKRLTGKQPEHYLST